MSFGFRIAHGTMAALFAVSVLLQFNDPSPLAWIALYTLATGACVLGTIKKYTGAQILGGIVLIIGLIAQIPYVRAKAWETAFSDLTREWHMSSEPIVDGREFYALIWIVAWMVVLLITARRAITRSADPAS